MVPIYDRITGWKHFQDSPITVPALTPSRLFALLMGILLLAVSAQAGAQDDGSDTPLGDVARTFRRKTPPATSEDVIDNDNLSKVVDDAEGRRAAGSSPVFSLDPAGNGFHISSPDVSCSLSFSAKNTSLLSDPLVLDELPRSELAKLDGPATIDGDSLQVSMHNGTSWDLREVVIGLTIVRTAGPGETSSNFGQARMVPALEGVDLAAAHDSYQKQPDVTLLLRVKGSAAPSATATFRTPLNFALFPDQEWHWAIVKAKGIPPPAPPDTAAMQPAQAASQLPSGATEANKQNASSTPASSNSPASSPSASTLSQPIPFPPAPDAATH